MPARPAVEVVCHPRMGGVKEMILHVRGLWHCQAYEINCWTQSERRRAKVERRSTCKYCHTQMRSKVMYMCHYGMMEKRASNSADVQLRNIYRRLEFNSAVVLLTNASATC